MEGGLDKELSATSTNVSPGSSSAYLLNLGCTFFFFNYLFLYIQFMRSLHIRFRPRYFMVISLEDVSDLPRSPWSDLYLQIDFPLNKKLICFVGWIDGRARWSLFWSGSQVDKHKDFAGVFPERPRGELASSVFVDATTCSYG